MQTPRDIPLQDPLQQVGRVGWKMAGVIAVGCGAGAAISALTGLSISMRGHFATFTRASDPVRFDRMVHAGYRNALIAALIAFGLWALLKWAYGRAREA